MIVKVYSMSCQIKIDKRIGKYRLHQKTRRDDISGCNRIISDRKSARFRLPWREHRKTTWEVAFLFSIIFVFGPIITILQTNNFSSVNQVGVNSLLNVFQIVTKNFNSKKELNRFKRLLYDETTSLNELIGSDLKKSIENIEINIRWVKKHLMSVTNWLTKSENFNWVWDVRFSFYVFIWY